MERRTMGGISSAQLVDACLARFGERDPEVQAWAFLDPDHARAHEGRVQLAQARPLR